MNRLVLLTLFLSGCGSCGLSRTQNAETIAVCILAAGDVRSHAASDTIWSPLELGGTLGDGDWVRTAENANAAVRFVASSSELAIAPGSTVIIQRPSAGEDRDVVGQISVRRGSVRAILDGEQSAPKLLVAMPDGKKMRVRPAGTGARVDTQITVGASGEVQVAVAKGRAEIAPPAGESITIAAGETHEIAAAMPSWNVEPPEADLTPFAAMPDAGPSVEPDAGPPPIADRLLEPKDGAEILFDRNAPQVAFTWSPAERLGTNYRVVVSKHDDLSNPLVEEATKRETLKTRSLGEGAYYWGVYAELDGKITPLMSAPRKLGIVRTRAGIRAPRSLSWK